MLQVHLQWISAAAQDSQRRSNSQRGASHVQAPLPQINSKNAAKLMRISRSGQLERSKPNTNQNARSTGHTRSEVNRIASRA